MTDKTIKRILDKGTIKHPVSIGAYLYAYDINSGKLMRCHKDDYGRQWIDENGEQYDGWKIITVSYVGE